LSAQGQVTIPATIRRRLGLREGENVIFVEKSGNVFITSENEANYPADFLSKDKRRTILRSLYSSINDPTFVEPKKVEHESPKDWELLEQ